MKIEVLKGGEKRTYTFEDVKDLEEKIKKKEFFPEKTNDGDSTYIYLKDSPDHQVLRLLVILSPIIISCFDTGKEELEFFKEGLKLSNFKYGLYPNFFEGFDLKTYFDFYESHPKNEDILLEEGGEITFNLNYLEEDFLLSLSALIACLILNEKNRQSLLTYFAAMRNDIVINGRRSILANGIQAFYLNKYVAVWTMDLGELIKKTSAKDFEYFMPVLEATSSLKRLGEIKKV